MKHPRLSAATFEEIVLRNITTEHHYRIRKKGVRYQLDEAVGHTDYKNVDSMPFTETLLLLTQILDELEVTE